MNNTRIHFLDTARVFAVLFVAIGHIVVAGYNENNTLARFFGEATKGNYPILSYFNNEFLRFFTFTEGAPTGVCLFFLITGYIIPTTFLKNQNRISFIISRFFRIAPPALLAMIVVFIFLKITFNIPFDIFNILKNYLSSLLSGTIKVNTFLSAFEPFWTLSIEIIFYLFIACLGKEINFQSAFLAQILFILLYLRAEHEGFLFLSFILFGSLFLFIEKEFKENKFSKNFYNKLFIMFIMFLVICTLNKSQNSYNHIIYIHSLVIFCLLYIFHLKFSLPSFVQKIVDFIANISYSFYLIHIPIGMGFALFIKLHYKISNPYIQTLSAFVACFVISYICYILFEKPSTRIGKFLIKKIL